MRLIDADRLNFDGQHYNKSQLKAILDFVDAQKTAYDVDKVVERLELHKACSEARAAENDECGDMKNMDISDAIALAYGKAIEIVKEGGVNG